MDTIKQLFFDYETIKCTQCNKKIKVKKGDASDMKKFCSYRCLAKYDQENKKAQ